ncbi:hypothetical protein ASE67_02750 [Sphingomonas sp. Leaf23]|uniref:Lar family restriction alleviation protein n=1 Tax=Sphingomonas sp. Leaf23 TaxID=1735689 RepID=UPI0006F5478A|nr:Lar family restriction alleviation protein [Sphingomonas sp. Leaf23]KQM88679.1 hypothetical protein ASE67_02750 [Sphingomonas sp. Leaf23]
MSENAHDPDCGLLYEDGPEHCTCKLLPCPFCGSEAKLVSSTSSTVQCQNDQCIIGDPAPFNDFSHRRDAIAAWNTRLSGPSA